MTQESPEFHTKTLSPVSPIPVHPPESYNIPVLQRQIDPNFSMTTTHIPLDSSNLGDMASGPGPKSPSTSSHSSFSDAYAEHPEDIKAPNVGATKQGSEVSDDYAMTFESDNEDQDKQEALVEHSSPSDVPETKSLPNVTVAEISLASSASSDKNPDDSSQNPPQTESQSHTSPSPIYPPSSTSTGTDAIASVVSQTTAKPKSPSPNTFDDPSSGGIDIQQLLDNITANAEKNAPQHATSPIVSTTVPKSSGLPTHASLPPRPNVPQVRPHEDIQKYHAGAPGVSPASSAFRAGTSAGSITSLTAPGAAPRFSIDPRGGLPPPPTGSFQVSTLSTSSISPALYAQSNRLPPPGTQKSIESSEEADDLDAKWGPEIQKIYDQFLESERGYVVEGLWDKFPNGSRLFIGNLPSEKVTKRDLFHVFHHYGKIAQISIKQAYGFVQFHESSACYNALKREEGSEVRGRKMHLEISKPQKNTRNSQNTQADSSGRARSPGRQRGAGSRVVDKYDGRATPRMGQDEYGRPIRIRDDYRPLRPPTPPRGNFRGRDEYMPRKRDSYDGRDHHRSRSRSPYGSFDDSSRYRERSPSPRTREAMEDASLQLARRDPRDVPDVHIIPMEPLDRQFLTWVENEMRGRVKVEVMQYNPRLPIQAVIRRQILEGVHAVAKVDMRAQNSCKISLQVFDRQGGINNVRFDEYQDLDPKIAAELTFRAKNTQQPAQLPNPPYIPSQYPPTQTYQTPASAPVADAPTIANIMGQLDNATLQKLLGTLGAGQPQAPQQQNMPAVNANSGIDLANFLGGFQQQQQPQVPQQVYQPAPMQNPYPAQNMNLSQGYGISPPQQHQQPPQVVANHPQQSAQQVQNIMAQLARYRQ